MERYLPYNPSSTVRVEESLRVKGGKVFLRHIPKQGSVVIEGFVETDSLLPAENQFSCQYALDSLYRDANRVLNFNAAHNGETLLISYIAIGTVVTADDMNEVKEHLETDHTLHTMSESIKGGAMLGDGLETQGDYLNINLTKAVEHPIKQLSLTLQSVTTLPSDAWAFYRVNGGNGGIILPDTYDDTFDLLGDNSRVLTRGTDYFIYPADDESPPYVSILADTFAQKITLGNVVVRWNDYQTTVGKVLIGNSLIYQDNSLHVALGTTPLTIEGSMWIHVP